MSVARSSTRLFLTCLIAYYREHTGDPLGERNPVGHPKLAQQVEGLRGKISPALAQRFTFALRQFQLQRLIALLVRNTLLVLMLCLIHSINIRRSQLLFPELDVSSHAPFTHVE